MEKLYRRNCINKISFLATSTVNFGGRIATSEINRSLKLNN